MSERKLKTTHSTDKELVEKARKYMDRLDKTGKEYNPAPKQSKNDSKGKIQK